MSRIGDAPVVLENGAQVQVDGSKVIVTGPKGTLELIVRPEVKVEIVENKVVVKRKSNDKFARSVHGLTRSLINNMVSGVVGGWNKSLEMVGVGYRAQGGGNTLTLSVGYSHPVVINAPEGISFTVAENTKITVTGIDRSLVGQVAANIRAVKPPEPYKGKGIRYLGEYIRRKAGKAGKAVAGGGAK